MNVVRQNRSETTAQEEKEQAAGGSDRTSGNDLEYVPEVLDEWHSLKGRVVNVRHNGHFYRQGWVEEVMPEGTGLWLAAYGPAGRELLWQGEGFTVHTVQSPQETTGRFRCSDDRDAACIPSSADQPWESGYLT
jgi:hypothetical protein